MAHQQPRSKAALTALLDDLAHAYAQVAEHVAAIEEPQQAFEASQVLLDRVASMRNAASDLRTDQVRRIWKKEELSLAKLADRIGVSKARADQITRAAKAAPKPEKRAERPHGIDEGTS